MAIFDSSSKSDVKLGFYIGIGLLFLGLLLAIVQMIFGRLRG